MKKLAITIKGSILKIMRISTMIKRLVKPKGRLTHKELADKLRVAERSIYYWKEDNAVPDYYTGKKIERMVMETGK